MNLWLPLVLASGSTKRVLQFGTMCKKCWEFFDCQYLFTVAVE